MAETDAITIELDTKEWRKVQEELKKNFKELGPFWKICRTIMHNSIMANFQDGGRPKKWKKHAPNTILRRTRKKTLPGLQPILQEHGVLKGALGTVDITKKNSFEYGFDVGLKKIKYAVPTHEGVSGLSRAGSGPFRNPPRPFVLFQKEDLEQIHAWAATMLFNIKKS